MVYNTDLSSLNIFYNEVKNIHEIPYIDQMNIEEYQAMLEAYLNACETIFELQLNIMKAYQNAHKTPAYVTEFDTVYNEAVAKAIHYHRSEIFEYHKSDMENIKYLVITIRLSQIAEEFNVLSKVLIDTTEPKLIQSHLNTMTVTTNSLKDLIRKHTKWKWMETILHTINEVIDIYRGS